MTAELADAVQHQMGPSPAVTRIAALTGKRGGLDAMRPMLHHAGTSRHFELHVVVTDQHLEPLFGETGTSLHEEFDHVHYVKSLQQSSSALHRAEALGRIREQLPAVLASIDPDVLILYGDRGESLEAASVATILGIPIAHLQGGDLSGSVDEQVRHAITKLAHMHFVSTEHSAARVRQMGESSWRVRVVGDHHLDPIRLGHYASRQELHEALPGLVDSAPPIVVLQHSETTAPNDARFQILETLAVLDDYPNVQKILIYPCSDTGYDGIVSAIEERRLRNDYLIFRNLPSPIFLALLADAGLLIGNSSSGIIEAPVLGTPVINVGRRQHGRLADVDGVKSVPHDRVQIREALTASYRENVDTPSRRRTSEWSDTAAALTLSGITDLLLDENLLIKTFCPMQAVSESPPTRQE